ncbi:MAG: hypothetical protein KC776_06890 [Myxococcales bacterium]|nr:hypothetical protein [Myxococcales bacterium]MCB9579176.1 hypothetical protein [Polyangiaceae bacterium]
MAWADFPEDQRALVLDVLTREAERLEREAVQLSQAAQRLGRPSLVERQELRANAFRAAIDLLTGAE